jgi:hypothetical protein
MKLLESLISVKLVPLVKHNRKVNTGWKGDIVTTDERHYVDTSSIQGVNFGGLRYCALIDDEYLC